MSLESKTTNKTERNIRRAAMRGDYVSLWMFKRKKRGGLAPVFGLFYSKDAAQEIMNATALLRKDYSIVRATLSEDYQ